MKLLDRGYRERDELRVGDMFEYPPGKISMVYEVGQSVVSAVSTAMMATQHISKSGAPVKYFGHFRELLEVAPKGYHGD